MDSKTTLSICFYPNHTPFFLFLQVLNSIFTYNRLSSLKKSDILISQPNILQEVYVMSAFKFFSKRRLIALAICLIFLIFGIILYLYINISGSEIQGIADISSDCEVTITKTDFFYDNQEVHVLTSAQTEALQELIRSSSFYNTFSSGTELPSSDLNHYLILVSDVNTQDTLLDIVSIGNEYIRVQGQFQNNLLKIRNDNWVTELEDIINMPNS